MSWFHRQNEDTEKSLPALAFNLAATPPAPTDPPDPPAAVGHGKTDATATPPSPAEVSAALNAFIEAPDWDQTRQVLEQQQHVLLTLDACLALIRRVGHASSASSRGVLSTCARILLIAYDRDIPTAWEWLEDRRQARAALNAAMKAVADLPPEQAANEFQRNIERLPPAQRQHANDILAEAADEAREAEAANDNGGNAAQPGRAPADLNAAPNASVLETAVKELLGARDEAALQAVIERYQQELLTGEAASILRYNATRARQDQTQAHGEEIARHLDQLAALLDRIQSERAGQHNTPMPTPMHPVTPATPATPASPPVIPPPTAQQRQWANMLLQTAGQLDEAIRRGLLAWMGTPGVSATPQEIANAYTVFLAATGSNS